MKFNLSTIALITIPIAALAAPTSNYGQDEIKIPNGKLGSFCGGIVGFPCIEGLACKLEGDFPDAGGVCVKNTD
ncbi:hypothetical protein B0J17DRAFT_683305 [Rhizoctonia solani]|nr:hypothetical protein B0J17DRAFT_683305 [Rhizoctonia solani]